MGVTRKKPKKTKKPKKGIFSTKTDKPKGNTPGGDQYGKKPKASKKGPVAKRKKPNRQGLFSTVGEKLKGKKTGGGQYGKKPKVRKTGKLKGDMHSFDVMSEPSAAKKGKVENMPRLMKKGYAKKHGLTKSAQMHYMENELYNEKHGHPIAAKHDAHVLRKHWTKNM